MTITEARTLAKDEPDKFCVLIATEISGWHEKMTREEWPHWVSDDDGCQHMIYPDYLSPTDFNPAMAVLLKVLEIIEERDFWGPSYQISLPLQGDQWGIEVWNDLHGGMSEPHTHDTAWRVFAESFQLAACLFGLMVVGVIDGQA